MQLTHIPAYRYPTTTVFIDGPSRFFEKICVDLPADCAYRIFNQGYEAIAYIKQSYNSAHIIENAMRTSYEVITNPIDSITVTLDIGKLHTEIYNPRRFSEVTVMVIDSDLMDTHFSELCQKFSDQPIRKILLVNKNQEKIALEALNSGIIDYVIFKNIRNLNQELLYAINLLSFRYFQQISWPIEIIFSHEPRSFIFDPAFNEFFDELCAQQHIVEYYLTEISGGFLLIDNKNQLHLLVVKSYEDLAVHYEFAAENGASAASLEQIRNGEKIPVSLLAQDYFRSLSAKEWEQQLYPAEEIQGQSTYYYAYVPLPTNSSVDLARVYNHDQYCEQLQKFHKKH